jgi:hypothetical protein
MKHTLTVALVAALLAPLPQRAHAQAQPQPAADALARCLSDSTTGKDRKGLARWVFLAMAAHPEIRQFASSDLGVAADESDKAVAELFTRLLAETCTRETRAAMKQGGSIALEAAFNTLGQLAMKELMSDAQVNARMAGFQKHLDQPKLNQALNGP